MKKTILFLIIVSIAMAIYSQDSLQIMTNGKIFNNGDTFYTPLNNAANTVALFSEQRDMVQVINKGKDPLTLDMIELKLANNLAEEEFSLQNTDLKPTPLNFNKTTLAPQKRFDFYVRFYPVHSGPRTAILTIRYNSANKFVLNIQGTGRTNAKFFSYGKLLFHKLIGAQKTDEMASAMVADHEGNIYFSGHVTQILDKFAYDIIVGKINKDGSLGWLKIWNGKFRDYCPDPGQNNESGGGANCMAIDKEGFLYLAGAVSPGKSNNNFASLVLKIEPKEGKIIWEKLWRPEWPKQILGKHNAQAYAVDVAENNVYVTGSTHGEAAIMVLVLDKNTGSLKLQRSVDVYNGYNDRGYCIKSDLKGNLYVGGSGNANGIVLKFSPGLKLEWARCVDLGRGGNINSLDVDNDGNLYLACDRRGATTFFSLIKTDSEGKLIWGKTYDASNNAQNNINFVKVIGKDVFASGRTGLADFDTQMGDGLVLKLSAKDGSLGWATFYFNGKGPDEISEHRIKGIAIHQNQLCMFGQVYTGNMNGVRYWGYWYDGTGKLSDYAPAISTVAVSKDRISDMPQGSLEDASNMREYMDGTSYLPYQDANAKRDGQSPDGDLMFWRLELKSATE